MKATVRAGKFKKDYRRMMRRGVDEQKFVRVVSKLVADEPLPKNCRVHMLRGEYAGFWECHVAPDWLLIYETTDKEVVLLRTGTHADLFE